MSRSILLLNNVLLTKVSAKQITCMCLFLLSSLYVFGFQNETISNTTPTIFTEDTTEIPIADSWQFYWNQLLEPGQFNTNSSFSTVSLTNWTEYKDTTQKTLPSFGYATYRRTFSIPKNRPYLSLYIPATYASAKTWINGKLISEIGHVGTTRAETIHRRYAQIIPLNSEETQFEIVIQVANFYHHKGGIDMPLLLGKSNHFSEVKFKRVASDMTFIGSLTLIGLFFLLFFLLYWNKDRAVLYFAILCLSLSYMALNDRYAPFAKLFPTASWTLLTTIEYIALFLAGYAASFFFYSIFYNFVHKVYAKISKYSFYLLCILAIFLPAPHFTRLVLPFLLLMIINLMYIFFVIIKAIASKRHESMLVLTSTLLASFIFFAHIFIFLNTDGNTIIYVNLGYILVFLLLSMLLMMRFADSLRALEKAKELAIKQKEQISFKSKELADVNTKLKDNVRHLEKMNAELDSFNHIVSHDLKAPLIAINTLVSFIEEDLEEIHNEEVTQSFGLLKGRVSKMYALINDLLEYSKITKGKKVKETFQLNDMLLEIVSIVNAEQKHVVNLPKDVEIHTNKVQLEHVFQNLIQNAIKHNDQAQAIIDISFSKKQHEYEFKVRDNGPGIEAKYHTKIFEMFSQLTVNNEVESTGIGLSIVKKIVTENYGVISVDSDKGLGTTITFTWRA